MEAAIVVVFDAIFLRARPAVLFSPTLMSPLLREFGKGGGRVGSHDYRHERCCYDNLDNAPYCSPPFLTSTMTSSN